MLWAAIGLPIVWFVTDFFVTILIGPIVTESMIMGIYAIDAIAFAVSLIIAAVFLKYALRLVRR